MEIERKEGAEIDLRVLLAKLDITHRHARGPGGQHVNKSKDFLQAFVPVFGRV